MIKITKEQLESVLEDGSLLRVVEPDDDALAEVMAESDGLTKAAVAFGQVAFTGSALYPVIMSAIAVGLKVGYRLAGGVETVETTVN